MTRLEATKARADFSDTLNRVAFGGERIMLSRRGKSLAALIPIEDLRLLERLTREEEDRIDNAAADAALAEGKPFIPWEKIKAKMDRRKR